MNANGGGRATPTGAPVRRPPDPGWSPLVHAGEPRKVYHEAGEGSATRTSPTIAKKVFDRKLTAADFYEDSDEDFWDAVDAEWACDICNDDGGGEEQGGDVEQDDDGVGQGPGGFAGGECAAGKESDAARSCGGEECSRVGARGESCDIHSLTSSPPAPQAQQQQRQQQRWWHARPPDVVEGNRVRTHRAQRAQPIG